MLCLSYYLLCILFNKIGDQEVEQDLPGSGCVWGHGRWEEVAPTMYTHVSKYKNDKLKERKKF
jgi:hypothetical protein